MNPLLDLELAQFSRRRLLQGFGAAALAWLSPPALREALAQPAFIDWPFRLGVAAGDPSPDGFVIWTRLAPRPLDIEAGYGMPRQPIELQWEVARDARFRDIAAKGTAIAHPLLGHSVHVEVAGLEPARSYWYRFIAGKERSFTGHARTLPAPGSSPARVRLAVAGCQHYEQGLFTAHRFLSGEELDFVYCYGDYIYEYRGREVFNDWTTGEIEATVRRSSGDEIHSLDEYRRRYAEYKMDANLIRAHAAHAWFCSWDDHEIDNNWADDKDQDGSPPEYFALRRAAAAQAYYEMMPLRKRSFPVAGRLLLNRRASFGDLLDLHFLDTRSQRSDQACGDNWSRSPCEGTRDAQATMLGEVQERWLFEGLASSKARWQGLAQQVMLAEFQREAGEAPRINPDSWAGYAVPRERLLKQLARLPRRNSVVLTGDEHQHYAFDLRGGDGELLASEFVASSISSGGDGRDQGHGEAVLRRNPHCRFNNNQRGYAVCEITPERWRTDFRVLDRVSRPDGKLSTRASFAVEAGRPGLVAA